MSEIFAADHHQVSRQELVLGFMHCVVSNKDQLSCSDEGTYSQLVDSWVGGGGGATGTDLCFKFEVDGGSRGAALSDGPEYVR